MPCGLFTYSIWIWFDFCLYFITLKLECFFMYWIIPASFFMLHTAFAQKQNLDEALWTGPLLASNPTAIPKGHFYAEPYLIDSGNLGRYDADWNLHTSKAQHAFVSSTLLEYGLTDRLTIEALPDFTYVDGQRSSDGLRLADSRLRAMFMFSQYQLGSPWPTMAVAIAQSFPLGRYKNLDNPANGTGQGAYRTTFSFYAQSYFWMPNGRILRVRLNVDRDLYVSSPRLQGQTSFGTPEGFDGKAHLGKLSGIILGFEYSLTKHWVPALDLAFNQTEHGDINGKIGSQKMMRQPIGESLSFVVAPALEYNWNERFGVIGGVFATVAGKR